MKVIMIAAIDEENAIAKDGEIPWDIPEDVEHFKETTMNSTIIMGRKTYESDGPLPGRKHIVLTSRDSIDGAEVASSPKESLVKVKDDVVYICGGEGVYKSFIDKADELIISHIPGNYEGDRFFPIINPYKWQIKNTDDRKKFRIVTYGEPFSMDK